MSSPSATHELARAVPRTTLPARRGIQSVETGLRVLASLAAGQGPQTLSAIGQRAGISPSQTHRYLQSLMAAGMAQQDLQQRYDLGPSAIAVGVAALSRADVFGRTEAAAARFVAETGRTALVCVWGDPGVVVVRWYGGSPAVHCTIAIGSVLPLLHSAAGHVFLALLPDAETNAQQARERAADHGVIEIDETQIRGQIRGSMLAQWAGVGSQPLMAGMRMMAAPVFDLQGRVRLAVAALATGAFAVEEDEAVAARLLAACADATAAAGGIWPKPTPNG